MKGILALAAKRITTFSILLWCLFQTLWLGDSQNSPVRDQLHFAGEETWFK